MLLPIMLIHLLMIVSILNAFLSFFDGLLVFTFRCPLLEGGLDVVPTVVLPMLDRLA